jgi:hypothetical protein
MIKQLSRKAGAIMKSFPEIRSLVTARKLQPGVSGLSNKKRPLPNPAGALLLYYRNISAATSS